MSERWSMAQYRAYLASGGTVAPKSKDRSLASTSPAPAELSEHDEQVRFFAALEVLADRHPDLTEELEDVYATASGGIRHKGSSGRLKESGVRKGVPDIEAWIVRGDCHGLVIEMKRERGGRASPEQAARIRRLRSRGYVAEICHGWTAALAVLCGYLGVTVPASMNSDVDLILANRCARRKVARSTRRRARRRTAVHA